MRKKAWFGILLVALVGCHGSSDESADSIGEALELDNGGYDFADEMAAFGDARFEDADLDAYAEIDDPMAAEATVLAMREAPDGVVHHVQLARIPHKHTT